ncbi:DUF1430 domain-containing protein [Oenococcus sp. UCMA 14587]|nr:DUF1430 domain-containing protein [Oenococcus sp. UCMA 14587]
MFLGWRLNSQQNQIRFESYSGADVLGVDQTKQAVNREKLTSSLNEFARLHHSLIARRIVVSTANQKTAFVYEKYGSGLLPSGLKKASRSLAQTSDLANSYLIVKGNLTSAELVNKIRELGYSSVIGSKFETLSLFLGMIVTPEALSSLAILNLCFTAMTLIYRIKDLRNAGIKLIAGKRNLGIVLEPVLLDLRDILVIAIISSVLGSLFLLFSGLGQLEIINIMLVGIFLPAILFTVISTIMSLVYLLGLNKTRLTQLLKGRLPLKWLLLLIISSQLIAVAIVGYSFEESLHYRDQLYEQEINQHNWQKNKDRYTLSFGTFINGNSEKESLERNKYWYSFANDAIKNQDALLSENNLNIYTDCDSSDGVKKTDYLPSGNTIYVTANYLDKQHIKIGKQLKKQLHHLKKGQFGLILPEKLKYKTASLTKIYAEYLNNFGRSALERNSSQLYTFQAKIAFVKNNQKRFLYNANFNNIDTQSLKDPIIVVMTPESTGSTPNSRMFWSSVVGNNVLFKNYCKTISLLKKDDVYQWVSYLKNTNLQYLKNVQSLRTKLISALLGSTMSIVTSIMLFYLMNLLYFEEFRKEIFIKRIAGIGNWSIHRYYLFIQGIALIFANQIVFSLTKNLTISVLTFIGFLLIAGITMYRQISIENNQAVTILKGK